MNNRNPSQTKHIKSQWCCPLEYSSHTQILCTCRRGTPIKGNANQDAVK